MIKYFDTEAAYQAATKSGFESEVALVGESNRVHYDGANVVVGAASAKTGSIAVLDGNSALHFISVDTYSSSSFMGNWTVVGVVAVGVDHEDYRGTLVIVHKTNASKVWSYIYSFKLTGYTLDGTNRSGVISVRESSDSWAANHDYTVNYNADDIEDFADQLNTYFAANAPFSTQEWRAVVSGEEIHLQFHYQDYRQASYNTGKTGFSMTANLLPGITATTAMLRTNGNRSGEGTITNMDRALAYFRSDNSSTTYNPSSDVTSINRSYPICLPGYLGTSQYQSDHCAVLRAYYGDGEEGWKKFMKSFLPVRPTRYGALGNPQYGDSKTNTALMAGVKFVKPDESEVAAFPAADYCHEVQYNHELLRKGKWLLPDMDTVFSIVKGIHYGTTADRNADPLNKALYAIGGSAISNGSYVWSSSRYGAISAWISSGGYGYAGSNLMYYSILAVPCVLLKLDEVQA